LSCSRPIQDARASDGFLTSRGVNSAGWGQVGSNPRSFHHGLWTETPRILSAFGATLITA
jgi:hypothetical protein